MEIKTALYKYPQAFQSQKIYQAWWLVLQTRYIMFSLLIVPDQSMPYLEEVYCTPTDLNLGCGLVSILRNRYIFWWKIWQVRSPGSVLTGSTHSIHKKYFCVMSHIYFYYTQQTPLYILFVYIVPPEMIKD